MPGGQTCHSTFRLPVPFNLNSTSAITAQSPQANYLRRARVIICDEASMIPAYFLTELDRLLQDIMENQELFGGKIVLLSGDLRQTLPVVPRSTYFEKLSQCLNRLPMFDMFDKFALTLNMRVNPQEVRFIEWLKRMGLTN